MRSLARLLITLRKNILVHSLLDALRPPYFDAIVRQVREVAAFDSTTDTYKSPS